MEVLIIGTGCIVGYLLNKNGKQNNVKNSSVSISPNNVPSGPLIYESNRVRDVDEYVEKLAIDKHALKVKQMYPETYSNPNNIYATDTLTGYPAALTDINALSKDSAPANFEKNMKTSLLLNSNTAAYNPLTGQPLVAVTTTNIDTSPMFRAPNFKPTSSLDYQENMQELSLLTGQPLDVTHANMQPMFGGMIKQPSVSNENSQVLLEKFTGIPSSDNQGTYSEKREVLNPFPNNPESLIRANITQVGDLYQRAQFGVKDSHEFQTNVKSFKDLPFQQDTRVLPSNIDATRGANNQQVTYEGVMVPGQKGSNRGFLPNIRENKFSLFEEKTTFHMNPNKSVNQGFKSAVLPKVRNNNGTAEYANTYLAPKNQQRKDTNISGKMQNIEATLDETVTRRINAYTPSFGAASGKLRGPNTGVIIMNDPEKGFETEYINQPHQNNGMRQRNVSAPDMTIRDTLADSNTGAINASGMKNNTIYKKQNYNVPITNKELNSENAYNGQPHKDLGMGYRKQNIEEFVTNKETLDYSNVGNPKGLPAHMSYDSIFQNDVDTAMELDRYGVAKGSFTKKVSDGGEITDKNIPLLVENYVTNPKGQIQKGVDRDNYNETVVIKTNKQEFGGHLTAGKIGNGEDGKRNSEMRFKKELFANGRVNPALKRDKNVELELFQETNLKPDSKKLNTRPIVHKTQPSQVLTSRKPVQIRAKNTEAVNPRFDTGIKITNDLYPWIK